MKKTSFVILFLFITTFTLSLKISALGISPDKLYIDVYPGEVNSQTITVYGEAEQEGNLTIYMYPYTMVKVGETDDREFFQADKDDVNDPGNWIKMRMDSLVSTKGSRNEVTFDYAIPTSASCGTNLAAIFYSSVPPETFDGGSVVGIKSNVVMQVHFNVLGNYETYCDETKTNLTLLDFRVEQFIPIFNWDNVNFITRLENRNKFIARYPRGFIEIFGYGVDNKITVNFNDGKLDVYPETVRQFDSKYIDPNYPSSAGFFDQLIYEVRNLKIGRYEARLGITAGTTNPIIAYAYFWVFPWKVILLILLIIIILYFYLKKRGNDSKKSKR